MNTNLLYINCVHILFHHCVSHSSSVYLQFYTSLNSIWEFKYFKRALFVFSNPVSFNSKLSLSINCVFTTETSLNLQNNSYHPSSVHHHCRILVFILFRIVKAIKYQGHRA